MVYASTQPTQHIASKQTRLDSVSLARLLACVNVNSSSSVSSSVVLLVFDALSFGLSLPEMIKLLIAFRLNVPIVQVLEKSIKYIFQKWTFILTSRFFSAIASTRSLSSFDRNQRLRWNVRWRVDRAPFIHMLFEDCRKTCCEWQWCPLPTVQYQECRAQPTLSVRRDRKFDWILTRRLGRLSSLWHR